ncbi:LysR family transcriptional regulator [Microvirga sp. CF3062]|uniref:LysR family transcriptional regulator n=1 Tax=Microvirga sp. CF3062 TaxID=3110182 RepID=UPI002E78E923|nr:LysR family transcriptional regulator [Microvirga sp. CF3062]MEE1655982.1 LysR family transcriptional regulator [Microvirga sp. CF3062]
MIHPLEPRLLQAFLAIYRTRTVTAAAEALQVSQPTMSGHLRRLRDHFRDSLFVRGPSELLPTPRADSIKPIAERILADLAILSAETHVWDPSTSDRRFRIVASVYAQTVILPRLDLILRTQAPGIRIAIEEPGGASDPDAIDLAFWPLHAVPLHHRMQILFSDRLVCLHNPLAGHPDGRMDLGMFCSLEHVLLAPAPSPLHDAVDKALSKLSRRRRVGLTISQPGSIGQLVQNTERLAILPGRLAALLSGKDLRVSALPVDIEPFQLVMSWPPSLHGDPGHRWFRGKVLSATKTLP